jgi:hypothetical protein
MSGGSAAAARRRHPSRANLKQHRGYIGKGKSVYYGIQLISGRRPAASRDAARPGRASVGKPKLFKATSSTVTVTVAAKVSPQPGPMTMRPPTCRRDRPPSDDLIVACHGPSR